MLLLPLLGKLGLTELKKQAGLRKEMLSVSLFYCL